MKASEAILIATLRAVALSGDHRLSHLARIANLDPRRDFKHADLSGADLRNDDLTEFDLTGANLAGAKVLGARFNATVSTNQLRQADQSARAVVILIGDRLLTDERGITARLGSEVFVPAGFTDGLRRSERDSHRRFSQTGNFVGDNSDLIRRRLSQALHATQSKSDTAVFVLVEPQTDFDFDALLVILQALERENRHAFVFIFGHVMASEDSGNRMLRARLRILQQQDVVAFGLWPSGGSYPRAKAAGDSLADKVTAIDFILAMTNATLHQRVVHPKLQKGGEAVINLLRGVRRRGELLPEAVSRMLPKEDGEEGWSSSRRSFGLLVREDLVDTSSNLQFGRLGFDQWGIAVFPTALNPEVEFYIIAGSPTSAIWHSFE